MRRVLDKAEIARLARRHLDRLALLARRAHRRDLQARLRRRHVKRHLCAASPRGVVALDDGHWRMVPYVKGIVGRQVATPEECGRALTTPGPIEEGWLVRRTRWVVFEKVHALSLVLYPV